MFYINVIGQQMYVSSAPERVVEGSQEFVKFRFHLSEEWNGLTTFAQFRQGNNAYNKYLDDSNTVTLPPEIKEGTCTLMLYGSHGTVIGTSNYITLRVDKNHFVSNAGSTQLSTSLYEQLVTAVADMENRLKQVEEHGVSSERLSEMIGEEVSKYLGSGQPTVGAEGAVLYNKAQTLTAQQRKTARENLGIYTDSTEPIDPQEGDVWIDPEGTSSGASNPQIHVKAYEQITDVLNMDFSEFKAGDIVLAYQVQSELTA